MRLPCRVQLIALDDSADKVSSYIEAGIAPATRRAYQSDLRHFRGLGRLRAGHRRPGRLLPRRSRWRAFGGHADRRLAAISVAHEAHKLPNPAHSPLVRATLRGIRREHGVAQRQAKPLLRDDLFDVLAKMGDRPKDLRDMALLLIGFAGAFRRSELCAIDCRDIEHVRQGIVITIRRSKTDQEGAGRPVGIPFGRTKWCPVTALDRWLSAAGIEAGPIFRRDRPSRARLARRDVPRGRVPNRSRARRRRRVRSGRLFRPQPARWVRDQRRASWRFDAQSSGSDRPRERRNARPLH